MTSPPEKVRVRVSDGIAIFEGRASSDWLRQLPAWLGAVDGLRGTDLRALTEETPTDGTPTAGAPTNGTLANGTLANGTLANGTLADFTRQRAALDGHRVVFATGVGLSPVQQATLPVLARDMQALLATAATLGRDVRFELVGLTDATGSERLNRPLREARAASLREQLVNLGVSASALGVRAGASAAPQAGASAQLRAVRIAIIENGADRRRQEP